MKRKLYFLIGAAVGPGLALSAWAQDLPNRISTEPGKAPLVTVISPLARPDATESDERNRRDHFPDPVDQGYSADDIDTTTQIRDRILSTAKLSVNGRKVRVITSEGQVTLRGPVESSEEKRLIGEIANQIVGEANVDNHLEVRLTASRKE